MSFSPPATYRSNANTGYLAEFLLGNGSSPEAFTAISEIKTFRTDPITMPEVDNTHLLSVGNTQEFVPGMIKPGRVTAGGNFIGDASQLNISTLAKAQTIFDFQIIAPVQRQSKTYTFQAQAFVTAYKLGPFENNKPTEFETELQVTGAFTENVA